MAKLEEEESVWHRWYAWRPVIVCEKDGIKTRVWFEWIERKVRRSSEIGWIDFKDYREVGSECFYTYSIRYGSGMP